MKNLKNNRWLAGITMIVLLLGVFFAVKAMENKTPAKKIAVAEQWFEFTGTSSDSPTNPAKYRLIEANEPLPDCNPGDQVCILNAPLNANNQPEISSNLADEIAAATSSQTHSTNVKVRE